MQHILTSVVDVCDGLVHLQFLFITDEAWFYPHHEWKMYEYGVTKIFMPFECHYTV